MSNHSIKGRSGKRSREELQEDHLDLLVRHALEFGIRVSETQKERFGIYLEELWRWNRRINLTGISSRRGMVLDLFLDSIIPAPLLPAGATVLDIGAGAGFPGLPLKICRPDLRVALVESRQKKANFLRHIVRLLGLKDIEVVHGRVGSRGSAQGLLAGYRVVTARGVAGLGKTIELAAPHLLQEGMLLSFQGQRIERLIARCEGLMERYGLIPYQKIPYVLPEKGSNRHILIFKKISPQEGSGEVHKART
ncbi:MAG: 16S rRNA (guanine(527)-N(7))-methyltransferase RsmG [Deltaproteobacteria bacterium]|nr:16S rRNA (guanine(527)-N(7))-methyltransferase RsmG [Deltaproteobacteria bacterium]